MLARIQLLLKNKINYLLGGLIILIAAGTVFSLIAYTSRNATHYSVLAAFDNDASVAITVAQRTRWYNSNDWFPYGPFYYRLSHTLAELVPFYEIHLTGEKVSELKDEMSHHFAMMAISLLSIIIFSYFIVGLFCRQILLRIIGSLFILAALLHNQVYSHYTLTAHPDMLFALMASLAMFHTYKLFSFPESKSYFFISACLWGVAASTKLSIVLFVPSFFLFFIPPFTKQNFLRLFKYGFVMLFCYFSVGFPQNFKIKDSIDFLTRLTPFSSLVTGEFLLKWLTLYGSQLLLPLVLLILFWIFFSDFRRKHTNNWWRFLLVSHIPFIFLISRQVLSDYDYYTIPFVLISLTVTGIALSKIGPLFKFPLRFKLLLGTFLLILSPHFFPLVPVTYSNELERQKVCREEYESIYNSLFQILSRGETIAATPYVPIPRGFSQQLVGDWDNTFEELKDKKHSYMAFNVNFYGRFLGEGKPRDYVLVTTPNWEPVREFYNTFYEKNDLVVDKFGVRWGLEKRLCQIEIWKKF